MQSTQNPPQIIPVEQLNKAIKAITEPFMGQTFSWVNVSYGDEIKLNFGKENIIQFKNGRTLKKGDWFFTTSASLWALQQKGKKIIDDTVFSGDSEEENETTLHQKFQILINQKIQSLSIQKTEKGLQTTLQFTENLTFDIFPHPNDPDLPLWKLFMPTEQVLTLENKAPFWSCSSIHAPA